MPEVVEPTRGAMSWERGWSWSTLCMAWSPSGRFRDILLLVLKGGFVHHGYNDKWYFTLYTLTSVCIFSILSSFHFTYKENLSEWMVKGLCLNHQLWNSLWWLKYCLFVILYCLSIINFWQIWYWESDF